MKGEAAQPEKSNMGTEMRSQLTLYVLITDKKDIFPCDYPSDTEKYLEDESFSLLIGVS